MGIRHRLKSATFTRESRHESVLKRSKLAVFAAVLMLLGSLSARPMPHVGTPDRDWPVAQSGALHLALSRPMDVAKALPQKAKRDASTDRTSDPVLLPPRQAIGSAPSALRHERALAAASLAAPWLAAWPRGPPAA